jgi:hypothetical protein
MSICGRIPAAEAAQRSRRDKLAMNENIPLPFDLPAVARKKVSAAFDGGRITSDGGVMLLAQAEQRLSIADQLARVIPDGRDACRVTHLLPDILRARIFAAMKTPTTSTGCGPTQRSSWPADGYMIPAGICALSRPSRGGRMRRACVI